MPYADLREFLDKLEIVGKLKCVSTEVDKDWEISSVIRHVFLTIQEPERYAILFENVKGYKGWKVVCGVLSSHDMYATALESTPDQICEKWSKALENPIEPTVVKTGPCKENVVKGDRVDVHMLPVLTWCPEIDAGPYITSPFVVTKDPSTDIRNVGTYRMQIRPEKTRTGLQFPMTQHIGVHLRKYEEMNEPMPVAVAIGCDPSIAIVSVAKIPYGVDEYAVAGGLRGREVELVKCETVDLEVPATAEIVLEGETPAGVREEEGPFGEHTGYTALKSMRAVFDAKCLTYRNSPIYQAFVSQKPPSESSNIRGVASECVIYNTLVKKLGLVGIKGVRATEASGAWGTFIVSIQKTYASQPMHIACALLSVTAPRYGKRVIIVDEDIDIKSDWDVEWALAFRARWDKDIAIIPHVGHHVLDPSVAPPDEYRIAMQTPGFPVTAPAMVIDATKKWPYPPVSLPPKKYLDMAREKWKEYGLPPLSK